MRGKGAVDSWTASKIRSKRGGFLGRAGWNGSGRGGGRERKKKNGKLKEPESKKYLIKPLLIVPDEISRWEY